MGTPAAFETVRRKRRERIAKNFPVTRLPFGR